MASHPASAEELTELSLKELLSVELFTAASMLPTQISKAPGTVYSFNQQDFKRFGVRRIDDLLQFVPGIQLNQTRKRHRAIWARGVVNRYNDKMVLMIDGVRMQHLYYGGFSLGDNVPLENIEKVEIILGPASSLYGANAFGGLISITTRKFSASSSAEFSIEAGDNDRAKATAMYNSERLQVFASALEQEAPFSESRKSFIGEPVLQPLDEEFRTLSLKAKPISGLTFKLDYYESEAPFLFIPQDQDAYIDSEHLTVSLSYEQGTIDTGRIEGNLYYQDDNTREYEVEQVTRSLGYEEYQNAQMMGAKITGLKRFDDHVVALGLTWDQEEADGTDYERRFYFSSGFLNPIQTGDLLSDPDQRNDNYSLYIQDVWALSADWNLTLGGRWDKFDQFGSYFNYRGALVFTPSERQTWKLLHGTAIRTPSFREYLKVLEGTSFIAPTPDAEETITTELGYMYQWDEANFNLNFYHNSFENFLLEESTPNGADQYFTNSDEQITVKGAEALVHWAPADDLSLRLGLSYIDTELSTTVVATPYVARWMGNFNLDYRVAAKHTLGLTLSYNSRRDDTNNVTADDSDSFTLVGLHAYGELTPSLSYSLGVDNLFDETVYDPAADFANQYNTERSEREFWLRLTWHLGQ